MPSILLYTLIVLLGISLIFVLTHLRPLSDHQLIQLARRRRNRAIRKYFRYDRNEYLPDMAFKKSMLAEGRFYEVSYPLFNTPSIIAALLKYKKHEWIVLAFEKDKLVDLLWLNKGFDNSSASLTISKEKVLRTALKNNFSTVIMCHNHPNSNPRKYSHIDASETDLNTAEIWGNYFNPNGVNIVKYVCERGKPYRYFKSPSELFLPVNSYLDKLSLINGKSRLINLRLHLERVFSI